MHAGLRRCCATWVGALVFACFFGAVSAQSPRQNEGAGDDLNLLSEFDRALNVLRSGEQAAFALYLRNHIQGQDFYCGAITDYQVVNRGAKRLTIKARCLGMPLYGLIFAHNKPVQIFGGDGMVAAFSNSDGPVSQVPLVNAQERSTLDAAPLTGITDDESAFPENAKKEHISWWLITSLVLNFLVVGGLLAFALVSIKRPAGIGGQGAKGLSTEDKNALIGQSVEVLRCIHRHPSGVYIVKGRHGKRRLFRTVFFAVLYRDYGLKIREIA